MTESFGLIQPVVVLIAWSMVMWCWMYATRLPAMKAAGMQPDPQSPRGAQMATLPASVRWKADNYNHLMEQPTLFYALALLLFVMDAQTAANLFWAWAYVVIRVIHSLIQVLWNKIEVRFLLFALSNIPLFALTINSAMMAFG